jgi:outer membrane murein-binding lipoprotein Lpp
MSIYQIVNHFFFLTYLLVLGIFVNHKALSVIVQRLLKRSFTPINHSISKQGGYKMKRLVVLTILLSLLTMGTFGCASKGFVREEVSRVENRLNNVDARVKSLESKVGDMASKRDVQALKRDVDRAGDMAQQASEEAREAKAIATEALTKADRAIAAFERSLTK